MHLDGMHTCGFLIERVLVMGAKVGWSPQMGPRLADVTEGE